MIRLSNSGPYSGPGTTYKFGNTLLTIPTQYVITPPSSGSDVRSAIQWLNSFGFYYASYSTPTANPGNSTLVKYGALYVWIPNQYRNPQDDSTSLYNLINGLQTGAIPGTTPGTGSTGSAISTATNWITGSTIISGVPNWGVALGGLVGYKLLKKVTK